MKNITNIIKLLLSIVIVLLCQKSKADQTQQDIDSLKLLIEKSPDSLKAIYCDQIAWEARYIWPEIAIKYALQATQLAKKTKNYSEYVKAYNYLGVIERNIDNFEEALEYYLKALEAAIKYKIVDQEGYGYNNIGNIYYYLKNYQKSFEFLLLALKKGEELKNDDIISYACLNLGLTSFATEKYNDAEQYFVKSYQIRKNAGKSISVWIIPLTHLAELYIKIGKFKEAKKILYTHIEYEKNKSTISVSYNKLSEIYFKENNYDSALYCGEKALEIGIKSNYKYRIDNAYNSLYNILIATNNYKKLAKYRKNQILINDTLYKKNYIDKLKNLKYAIDFYEKETKIKTLEEEKIIQEKKLNVVSLILITILLLGIIILNKYIKQRKLNKELNSQKQLITNNIIYASKIQKSILPNLEKFGTIFSDKFLIYKPLNIVSGDFYWQFSDEEYEIIAIADCTGHGVPGASMSMLGSSALQQIALLNIREAHIILEKLREMVKTLLHQTQMIKSQNDGMDIALMIINKKTLKLDFAGAYLPLYYIRDNQLYQLNSVRNPISIYIKEKPFKSEYLQLQKGDCIYLSTDGYTSQFGGDENKKMPIQLYKDLILKYHKLPMNEQKQKYENFFIKYKGNNETIDDVCVAGFRV
ncbi:MAG: tetratricopeptide repeat protein [Bacteroidales bacterium]|nr:tetratricopeptide repeat protein [Bacteroidales bacterium]